MKIKIRRSTFIKIFFALFLIAFTAMTMYMARDISNAIVQRNARIEEEDHLRTLTLNNTFDLIIDNSENYMVQFLQGTQVIITNEEGIERVLEVDIIPTGEREMPTISKVVFSDTTGPVMSFEVVTQTWGFNPRNIRAGLQNLELGGLVIDEEGISRQAVLIRH